MPGSFHRFCRACHDQIKFDPSRSPSLASQACSSSPSFLLISGTAVLSFEPAHQRGIVTTPLSLIRSLAVESENRLLEHRSRRHLWRLLPDCLIHLEAGQKSSLNFVHLPSPNRIDLLLAIRHHHRQGCAWTTAACSRAARLVNLRRRRQVVSGNPPTFNGVYSDQY